MEKLKILVFDDAEKHRQAAIDQLDELYDLTVVASYDEAEKVIIAQSFDILLTDLLVPSVMSGACSRRIGEEMPLGTIIAFLAIKKGVRKIAIISATDHHSHPASAALDVFGYGTDDPSFDVGDLRLLITSTMFFFRKEGVLVKDWKKAVSCLTDE